MAVEGSLDLFQLPEILQIIAQENKTGILTVQGEFDIIAVSFLNGQVVAADSLNETKEEALGEVLIRRNLLNRGAFDEALAGHKRGEGRLEDVLVEGGHIERAALFDALHQQTYDVLFQLLDWRQGDFKFYGDDAVPQETGFPPISVEHLLLRKLDADQETGPLVSDGPLSEAAAGEEGSAAEASFGLDFEDEEPSPFEVSPPPALSGPPAVGEGLAPAMEGPDLSARPREGSSPELRLEPPPVKAFEPLSGAEAEAARDSEEETSGTLEGVDWTAAARPLAEAPPEVEDDLEISRGLEMEPKHEEAVSGPRSEWIRRLTVESEPGWFGWIVALVTGVILAGAIWKAPSRVLLPLPWDAASAEALSETRRAAQYHRINRASEIFFLLEGRFADDLRQLVDLELLSRQDLRDPDGRSFGYSARDESYRVQPIAGGDPVDEAGSGGTIRGNFLLDPEFLTVPRGTRTAPLILLD